MSQRVQEKMAAGLITGVLRGLHYPVGKEDLGHEARQQGAPGALIEVLARMPERQCSCGRRSAGRLEGLERSVSPIRSPRRLGRSREHTPPKLGGAQLFGPALGNPRPPGSCTGQPWRRGSSAASR